MGGRWIFLILVLTFALPFVFAESFGYSDTGSCSVSVTTGNLTQFLQLSDTPGSYTGQGGLCLAVNSGETAVEFVTCGTGGSDGNASSICSGDQVLLGNGTCQPSSQFFDDTDTDTQKNTTGQYLYNDTNTIYFNETQLNDTIDLRASGSGDNSSWNESYAREIFAQNTTTSIQLLINNTVTIFSKLLSLDWTNVTITESQISDLSHTVDTNESLRFENLTNYNCGGTDKMVGVHENGTPECATDQTGAGGKTTNNFYLYNDSSTIFFNETQLNDTIDLRDSDTIILYDQDLNTTDNVTFARINATDWTNVTVTESQVSDLFHTVDTSAYVNCSTDEVFLGNGSCLSSSTLGEGNASWNQSWANELYAPNTTTGIQVLINNTVIILSNILSLDWSNVTITESQISDLSHTVDTNESLRFENLTAYNCGGSEKVVGVHENGTVECDVDQTGEGGKNTNNFYLYNDSGTIFFNETQLNDTIDARDSDTITVDTSAYVNCTGGETFLGNGSCQDVAQYFDDTDTNTEKKGDGNYLYNDTDTIYYNETKLNATIDLRAGDADNSSWNQSWANELYAPNTTSGIQILINNTMLLFSNILSLDWGNVTITESQISDLVHTIDTSAYVNCTGGEVLLGNGTCQPVSQYFDNTDTDTWYQHDQDLNTTDNVTFVNLTLTGQYINGINISNVVEGSHTVDTSAYVNCSGGEAFLGNGSCQDVAQYFDDTDTDTWYQHDQDLNTTSNVTFAGINATDWTNVTVTESQISDLSHTVDTSAYVNCSGGEAFLGNGTCQPVSQYFDNTDSGNTTQEIRDAVNDSIRYDFTANSSDYWDNHDTTNSSQFDNVGGELHIIDSWLDTFVDNIITITYLQNILNSTGIYSTYNETYDSYATNVSTNWTATTFDTYNEVWTATYNTTYDGYATTLNETDLVLGVNTTSNIQNLINNTMMVFTKVFSLDWTNVTITESQISDLSHTVDTSASVNCSTGEVFLGNGSCMGTDIYLSTYNATYDAHAEMDYTNLALTNESNAFAENQTFSKNITLTGGHIFSNATCVSTYGATATLHVC